MKRTLLGTMCAAVSVAALSAQNAAPPASLSFDVATIKVNRSNETGGSFGLRPGGVVVITNNTLRNIVRNSYAVQNTQIAGGPEWFDTVRFDITAKAPASGEGVQPEQVMAMMQRLLAERFKLVVRREMRPTPVYALVVARSDGRLGPQLRKATVDCRAILADARARNAQPVLPPPVGDRPSCGTRTRPGVLMAAGVRMADLARNLERPSD